MRQHPYKYQPKSAFWSQSVSNNFIPSDMIKDFKNVITKSDTVVSAGSCFASNLIPYLESVGVKYLRTEKIPNVLESLGENLGYANFSAAYGNVYTARQLRQLYERALDEFHPIEDRWTENGKIIDVFRPGLRFPAQSNEEFDYLKMSHLQATRRAFESADVFVFTLGLTEAWVHKKDGATYPTCPGTVAGEFDPLKYEFINFNVDDVAEDLEIFIKKLRLSNPNLKVILTVSPVPLVATATNEHVLVASTYSKSVLRVAVEKVTHKLDRVYYFPAFEIITGPQAPEDFFEHDRRNVSKHGVEVVMNALIESCNLKYSKTKKTKNYESVVNLESLSNKVAVADCDEVMIDHNLK